MMAECSVVAHCAGRGGPRLDLAPSPRFVFVGSSREREPDPSVPPGCTSAGESWIIRVLTASVNLPEVSKGPAGLRLRGPPHHILLGGPGLPGKAPLCVGVFSTVAPTGVAPQGLPVPVKLLLGGGPPLQALEDARFPRPAGHGPPSHFLPQQLSAWSWPREPLTRQAWLLGPFAARTSYRRDTLAFWGL